MLGLFLGFLRVLKGLRGQKENKENMLGFCKGFSEDFRVYGFLDIVVFVKTSHLRFRGVSSFNVGKMSSIKGALSTWNRGHLTYTVA